MCGISVIVGQDATADKIKVMGEAISHRGTDHILMKGRNFMCAYNWLKITDQNANPSIFSGEGYICLLNGYISNYQELAAKYEIPLTTNCDSELLTKFLRKFGLTKLNELNGFFAVAYFDGKKLHTFTDRYGIKQLYQYVHNRSFYICSEIKGIKAVCPDLELDPLYVADWRHSLGVMSEDNTIYKGVTKVKRLPFIKPEKIEIEYEQAKNKLRILLTQSFVRNIAKGQDSGVFLSGGIDSGILAFFNPDYLFSMDYLVPKYSEIELIKENALVGRHYTMIANYDMYNTYCDVAASILDDPRVASCYTNYALTELASKFVKVIYSGAGGDEVFGGYPHRNNKPIREVIKRTDYPPAWEYEQISHDEYNWRYLQGVLTVEDRMASHFTMETRYPLLDNDFVDFALSLPDEYLKDKKILKDISGLSKKVLNSPKKGWSNPYITNQEWTDIVIQASTTTNG